jgi:ABC-type Fe3+/spermidine/putrescine transport system ATPase subunit
MDILRPQASTSAFAPLYLARTAGSAAEAAPAEHIALQGISKSYDGKAWAVDTVHMAIGKGEFVSLLGPSGSGKTTLLRIIAGLETPTQGKILIEGRDVTGLPPHRRGVAMVFQDFLLFPHKTVRENLAFPLRMLKAPRDQIAQQINRVVDILSLRGLEERYPSQLSGGQQQRVALGRGLVAKPKALLLDEPLANLDRELRQEMEVEVRACQRRLGIPFIYVTHNQEEALSMSDRIAVVHDGRLEDFADRERVYNRPATAFVAQFVGRSNRFDGVVAELIDGTVIIDSSNRRLVAPTRSDLAVGQRVSLFVKNEKIDIRKAQDPQGNSVPCTLRDVIFRGVYADYMLACGDQILVASRSRGGQLPYAGEALFACWQREDGDIFPI